MSRAAFIARGFMGGIGRVHPGPSLASTPRAASRHKEQTMPNDTPAIATARAEGFSAGITEALGRPHSVAAIKPPGARPDDSKTMLSSMEREIARTGLTPRARD